LLAAREVERCFFLGRLELNNTLADFYTRQPASTLEFTGAGLVGESTGQGDPSCVSLGIVTDFSAAKKSQ
jgi:hypothetical protein